MSTNPLHSSFVLSMEAQPESNGFLHDIAEFLWGGFFEVRGKIGSCIMQHRIVRRSVGGVLLFLRKFVRENDKPVL